MPETPALDWLDSLPKEAKAALIREAQEQLDREKLADYSPYPKQALFHALGTTKRERLLRAGNQQGKSHSAGAETAYHLTGEYPAWWKGKRWDRPTVVWAAGETGEAARDNVQRVLLGLPDQRGTGLIPARCLGGDYGLASGVADLIDYIKVRHISGGWSFLRIKYYAQGRRKWQGPPVDFLWLDEEPPEDIYDEGLARTIATGGIMALSFTPLLGMSSIVKRFLLETSADRADINMTIEDAQHIPAAERARIIASFAPHERDARARGIPTLGSGRIYPVAEDEIKVAPFAIPAFWPEIGGIDFGWDHPSGAVKLRIDPDADVIYITHAYRKAKATPLIHAAALKAWGKRMPWAWPADGLQTEKGTGIQLAEQYREHGMNFLADHAQFEEAPEDTRLSRVSVEAGIAEILERMQTGRFKVFSHLEDWFQEFRLYHRKDGKIVKLAEDVMDATRYAYMMRRYATVPTRDDDATLIDRPPPNWRAA